MKTLLLRSVGVVIVALSLNGCATTNPIVSEWRNPAYGSASFKRIMVGGLGGETSVRRNFEDEFVFQLRAAGIDALRVTATSPRMKSSTRQAQANRTRAGADAMTVRAFDQRGAEDRMGPNYIRCHGSASSAPTSALLGGDPTARRAFATTPSTLPRPRFSTRQEQLIWTGTIKTSNRKTLKPGSKPTSIR